MRIALTLRLPPVIVTFTNRRVYVILFLARPLGVFFFSWGSTCASQFSELDLLVGIPPQYVCGCRDRR